MTSEFRKSQLNAVLSALDGQPRNPNTKDAALRAIDRHAERLGAGRDDLLTAAAGLLDGRMSAEAFLASLQHAVAGPAGERAREPDPAATDGAPLASEATDAAGDGEDAPVAATAAHEAEPDADDKETNEAEAWEAELKAEQDRLAIAGTRALRDAEDHAQNGTPKQQLLAACQAAEHWLLAERDRPGETRPDGILRVLRAAIERADGQRKVRETHQPGQSRHSNRRPRESTKEAMLIDMLRRPEGATIAQIIAVTGWQAHTVRGAFAGALKRKRGLTVTSEKPEGDERGYRIAG